MFGNLQVLCAGGGAPPDLRPGGHQRQDDPGPGRPHQVPQEANRPDEEHLSLSGLRLEEINPNTNIVFVNQAALFGHNAVI